MKQLLKLLFILLSIIDCLRLYAQKGNSQTAIIDSNGPQFSFITSRIHDFGSVLLNSNTFYEFQFKNIGNEPLVITDMHEEKGMRELSYKIQINYPKKPIKPGRRGSISIKFVAQDETGSFKKEIYVTSNATSNNYPLLLIFGAVVPEHQEGPDKGADINEFYSKKYPPLIAK